MTVNYEKTGATTGELTFTIEEEKVKQGLDIAFKRVKNQLSVPGFRKGKVPRKMFNQMYGEEALYEDALNAILPEAYMEALSEADVEPVDQPDFEPEKMEKDSDWVIKALLTLKPEVKLGDYKNLDVTKQDREVEESDVDEQLEEEREQHAELVVVDREAKEGDTVVIDFLGKKDGEAFDGGAGNNYPLEIGSNSFIPGFEEQLVGTQAEDQVDVEVTFPEDYTEESLAGEEAVFEVTVHEVKERQVPELDDDFAQDVDEDVENLAELREKRLEELKESKEAQAKAAIEEEAIRKAVENAEIEEIPEAMTHEEVHRQMEIFLNNLQSQGISPEMYYQISNTTEQDLHESMEEDAELRVRTNLVLEEIVAQENIEISEEERDSEINNLAKEYGLDVETVKEALTDDMLDHDIKLKQAIDIIVSSANESLESEEEEK
ncbi:MAG: trigger factor [Atopococcus tabaci]|uniref:Trigger factor n=1 Tax=Atopococcus tabaci TaxID=269774 RepID=A0AA43RLZ2_9LACT|nr:trigger factor [Atopococcus tabaci]